MQASPIHSATAPYYENKFANWIIPITLLHATKLLDLIFAIDLR